MENTFFTKSQFNSNFSKEMASATSVYEERKKRVSYEFDCKLDGYGALGDPKNQRFPDMEASKADHYFELAII